MVALLLFNLWNCQRPFSVLKFILDISFFANVGKTLMHMGGTQGVLCR